MSSAKSSDQAIENVQPKTPLAIVKTHIRALRQKLTANALDDLIDDLIEAVMAWAIA